MLTIEKLYIFQLFNPLFTPAENSPPEYHQLVVDCCSITCTMGDCTMSFLEARPASLTETVMRILSIILLVVAALWLTSCGEEGGFGSFCQLTPSMLDNCANEVEDSKLTCIYSGYPTCNGKVCAIWQESRAFCTRTCTDDGGCPGDATCQQYFEEKFCIPNVLPEIGQ